MARLFENNGYTSAEGIVLPLSNFRLFTDLKLGISLGELPTLSHEALHTMLINAMPATLSLCEDSEPQSAIERDRARASFIRKAMEVSKV